MTRFKSPTLITPRPKRIFENLIKIVSMKVPLLLGYPFYNQVEKRETCDLGQILLQKCGSSLRGIQRQKSEKARHRTS